MSRSTQRCVAHTSWSPSVKNLACGRLCRWYEHLYNPNNIQTLKNKRRLRCLIKRNWENEQNLSFKTWSKWINNYLQSSDREDVWMKERLTDHETKQLCWSSVILGINSRCTKDIHWFMFTDTIFPPTQIFLKFRQVGPVQVLKDLG